MSWLKEAASGEAMPAYKEKPEELTMKDPYIPNRMVSNKTANRPFLAHAEYKERRKALHDEWVKKKEERDAKIARGEDVEPLGPDPTAVTEVGIGGVLKFLAWTIVVIALAGKFITDSYTWDYQARWGQIMKWMPKNDRLLSPEYIARYNGDTPGAPIYLSIDGDVYDVTEGHSYQPGGSYAILAGKEGARAFGTGCFKQHMTHDTRGLDEGERQSLEHWKKFYANHKTYYRVGRLLLPPVDPASPIPPHCDPKKRTADEERRRVAAERSGHAMPEHRSSEEGARKRVAEEHSGSEHAEL